MALVCANCGTANKVPGGDPRTYVCGVCGQPSLQRLQTQEEKNALAAAIAGGAIVGSKCLPNDCLGFDFKLLRLAQGTPDRRDYRVLVLVVPWYIREHMRRKGDCQSQVWFMFSINVIGVVAGLYVLLPTLIAALGKNPVNDQQTLMAAFGSFAVVIFTGQNLIRDIDNLFSKEIQPKQQKQSKTTDIDAV